QDARQERSRFDTFIRTQTFLDQLTGTANRVLFDSKLETSLSENGAHGGVLLIRIDDWTHIKDECGKKDANDFIVEVGEALSNVIQRYPDVTLSRYYSSDFAIFAPNLSSKEVSTIAVQCLKQL
ncbi:diguanylate phosphodiesterase, partial [Vibrio xuii]